MITEAQLRTLYCDCQLSMMETASRLKVTHATVLYWLKKYRISRRSWSESTYAKQNPNGDPFLIPEKLSSRRRELMIAGMLLYWAEGSKGGSAMRIANLDPRRLHLFIKFLRNICHVNEQRLFVYVRLHKQFSLAAARRHWSSPLSLAQSRIFVYPHTDARSKADKQWSRYGIATLEFHSTKLKRWLDDAIEGYIRQQLGNGMMRGRAPREARTATGVTPKA